MGASRVYSGALDHTSVLKLLGEKFNRGRYSPEVDAREVQSLSAAFRACAAARGATPEPPSARDAAGEITVHQEAFRRAAARLTINGG